ncbi:MAG: hypothetical protein ABIQ16_20760 [Polyangiaceae bacterium]
MRIPRFSTITLIRTLLALCITAYALLLASLGCSSGAVCYRQTDCPSGTSCHSGQCVRAVGDGGVAGGTSEDTTAVSAGGDGTAGSQGAATAGADGNAGGT